MNAIAKYKFINMVKFVPGSSVVEYDVGLEILTTGGVLVRTLIVSSAISVDPRPVSSKDLTVTEELRTSLAKAWEELSAAADASGYGCIGRRCRHTVKTLWNMSTGSNWDYLSCLQAFTFHQWFDLLSGLNNTEFEAYED